MTTQECSTTDSGRPAAFATRSKPASCLDCIDTIVRTGGLVSAEPFTKPSAWRLTTCRSCEVQAHYCSSTSSVRTLPGSRPAAYATGKRAG